MRTPSGTVSIYQQLYGSFTHTSEEAATTATYFPDIAPPQKKPCTPWKKPCIPPGKNHACPPEKNHACPPQKKPCMPPGKNHTHPLEQPRMPPRATTHAPPEQPRMPPSNHACPPVNRITDACENITLPQLRCGR